MVQILITCSVGGYDWRVLVVSRGSGRGRGSPVRVRSGRLAGGVVRHHAEVGVRPAEVVGGRRRRRRCGRAQAGRVRVGAVEDHAQVRLVRKGARKTAREIARFINSLFGVERRRRYGENL